jgi:hypothetical protein
VVLIDRLFVAATVLIVAGCSSDGLVVSTGTVTCDGQLVADGAISFHPFEKGVAPQGGRIIGGEYSIRGRPGRQRVEIVASRPKANAPELTPGMKPMEQFLPARYNTASTLEADVTADGRNVFDFDLQTAPPER